MKIKLDPADVAFSRYVRTRDGRCMRCSSPVEFNEAGLPVTHQCSHFFGRGRENTRFDPENCDTLCCGCHQHWGSADKEGYRNFKVAQLGLERFTALAVRANTTTKKDRKLALIVAKQLLKSFGKGGKL